MKKILVALPCALLLAQPLNCCAAPKDAQTNEIASLREEIRGLAADISQIKKAVLGMKRDFDEARQKRTPVDHASLALDQSSADDYAEGAANAPITIMEFFDFQCGFCARFHKSIYPKLKAEFIDTGKVRYIFRDYILNMHPFAADAASVASCAGKQGKYQEMQNALFNNADAVNAGEFDEVIASVPGIDGAKFTSCLESAEFAVKHVGPDTVPSKEAQADMDEGEKIGVMGTPAFFVYKTAKPGQTVDGVFIRGDQDLEVFRQLIQEALSN